eukprot:Skav226811  [mRNA]  locus=scaffold2056:169265:169534:- [translate_table: standard]
MYGVSCALLSRLFRPALKKSLRRAAQAALDLTLPAPPSSGMSGLNAKLFSLVKSAVCAPDSITATVAFPTGVTGLTAASSCSSTSSAMC